MKKNIFYKLVLAVLIVVSLVLAKKLENLKAENEKILKENIVGTYRSGNEHEDADYLAFYEDGKCISYRQNEDGEEYKYKKDDLYYTLSNDDIAIIKDKYLLVINDGNVLTYEKTDNEPTLINVKQIKKHEDK